jgi:hypothetical protein
MNDILREPSRRVRTFCFSNWAEGLEPTADYLARLATFDVRTRVSDARDERLVRMARLDCDWYGENARCFGAMTHDGIEFLPARVFGPKGVSELLNASQRRPADEEWWVIFVGQLPQALGPLAGKVCALLQRQRVKIAFYAFDEVSRTMACFNDIAPHLDVLIHDEAPLAEAGRGRLRPDCVTMHRSWVANVVPHAVPFNPVPEEKILFLGSQLGLTPHRQRQIDFLRGKFKDRFVRSHDHSVAVADRDLLNRYKVGLCPEGRKFTTPAMAHTHTDRPFWSGCLGLVPVSENSASGGRLEELYRAGLIVRYEHGDLKSLATACERALAMGNDERRRIYEHFNRHEAVGAVTAEAIAATTLALAPATATAA